MTHATGDADFSSAAPSFRLLFRPGLAVLLALVTMASGCSTRWPPSAAATSFDVPIRFIDAQGDPIPDTDRPPKWRPALGFVSGAINGLPTYPHKATRGSLGTASTVRIDLLAIQTMLDRSAATLTAEAANQGLKIEPAETRVARLATTMRVPLDRQYLLGIGFFDSQTKQGRTLVFFDRPCRVTGMLKTPAGTPASVDLTIQRSGLTWLEIPDNGADGPVKIVDMSSELIFAAQPWPQPSSP